MSSQQQKSKRMEKPVLGYGHCAGQMNAKPFSIRHYVLMSRQKNMAQSWPFSQKYLKLCRNNGISNILPPLETPSSSTDGLNGRLVIDLSLDEKENHGFGKVHETNKLDETEKISKPGEGSSLEDTIHLLCGKLGRLSLSFRGDTLFGKKKRFKAQNNTCDKGRRRKGKTKMKSLVEILAVAKRCILDGNDRIVVAGCCSAMLSGDEQSKRKVKGMSSTLNSTSSDAKEDIALMKKHGRSEDSVTGIGQCNKRRRSNMGMVNSNSDGCKLKSWGRKTSSYKTAETEKKPGGFERKDLETYQQSS